MAPFRGGPARSAARLRLHSAYSLLPPEPRQVPRQPNPRYPEKFPLNGKLQKERYTPKDPGTKRSKTDDSDPLGPDRGTIWLCRNDDAEAKKRCRNEFTVRKVRQTHEEQEAADARELHKVYETLIDCGAHPNPFGVMTALSKIETDNQIDYSVDILNPKREPALHALKMAVTTAIGALKTFQLVFPKRFTDAGLDLEIEKLILQANALKGSTGSW